MKFSSLVISNGRVTIPKHIREKMGIEDGDSILVNIIEVEKGNSI